MTDVGIAPPPAPAPAPQVQQAVGEVPINPNPVNPPAPIGSQAPPARDPQGRREATRETIRKAFQRASDPGPAKPAMGHNRPPEPMAKEPPKAAKPDGREARDAGFDLKKRPDDRPRAEHGHFAARAQEPATAPGQRQAQAGPAAAAAQGQPAAPVRAVQLPAGAPYAQPLKRLNDRAKAEWGAAPESVRAEVWRMHKEYSNYAQAAARRRRGVRAGQAVPRARALARHHAAEGAVQLRRHRRQIARRSDRRPRRHRQQLEPAHARGPQHRLARHCVACPQPDARPAQSAADGKFASTAIAHQLGQLHQQQQAIAQGMQRLQYERAFSQTRSEVDRFAETHPRLDELGDLIEQELRVGYDLPTAYKRAELLRPATHAAQTRTPTAQTRTSDRSIRGAPDGGQANGHGRSKTPLSRRDAIARNIKTVAGAL